MAHPATQAEIIDALEASASSIIEFFSSVPDPLLFTGDPDHWGPAHHLAHLTQANVSVERAMRSGVLPPQPTGRSRTYAEVRDLATTSLDAAPKDRLLEMGRRVVVASGTDKADLILHFATTTERLHGTAATWAEEALDRHTLVHPLMGALTVREMLLFFVVHERHHLKLVRTRLEGQIPP